MTPSELQTFLHASLPLVRAMQVSADACDDEHVILRAPLAPNINQHGTGFGGSIGVLATLAAWSLVHVRLLQADRHTMLVVRHTQFDYEQSVDAEFTARAALKAPEEWAAFEAMLDRKGRSRISAVAHVDCNGRAAGRFEGVFVAVRK